MPSTSKLSNEKEFDRRWFLGGWRIIYFRLIFDVVFKTPTTFCCLVNFAARPGILNALLVAAAIVIDFFVLNGITFRHGARVKERFLEYTERFPQAVFDRIEVKEFEKYFDLSFLIPSVFIPRTMLAHFKKNRVHVFLVRRGVSKSIFSSPRAFVSPLSQDVYVLVRSPVSSMSPAQHFILLHELGHGAGMYAIVAQRNLVGLACVFASIVWVVSLPGLSFVLMLWTALQVFLCLAVMRPVFNGFRDRQRVNAEIVADYLAIQHLSQEQVRALYGSGAVEKLVQSDMALNGEETEFRRKLLAEQLRKKRDGESIDVPNYYLAEAFSHPPIMIAFTIVHWCYLAFASLANAPSTNAPLAFLGLTLLFWLGPVMTDARARVTINRQVPHS